MINCTLGIIPGPGFSNKELFEGTSLAHLIHLSGVTNRIVHVNNQVIEEHLWNKTIIHNGDEILLAGGVRPSGGSLQQVLANKRMIQITFGVIPGWGFWQKNIPLGSTLQQFVEKEDLHAYNISLQGTLIKPKAINFNRILLFEGDEILATPKCA